jgi:hypothetical protein
MPRVRSIVFACSALAFGACKETSAPVTGLDALRLTLAVSPTRVTAGAPVDIALTILNRTPRSVSFGSCPIHFVVRDPVTGGLVGGSTGMFCLAYSTSIYAPITLGPLESRTLSWRWADTQGVPAGRYAVHGWVNTPERESPPVTIEVVAAGEG